MSVSAKTAELKRAGRGIISLAAGEPDFATPADTKHAAIATIQASVTKYT